MTDMSKSRKLGFTEYQDTRESFFNLFDKEKYYTFNKRTSPPKTG
jgi:hypothetical protein